jgi:dynein heavy chain
VELLKQFKEEFMKIEKERQELANAEKLFGIPITSYPVLMNMEQELKGLEQIFSIYERQKVIVLAIHPMFKNCYLKPKAKY